MQKKQHHCRGGCTPAPSFPPLSPGCPNHTTKATSEDFQVPKSSKSPPASSAPLSAAYFLYFFPFFFSPHCCHCFQLSQCGGTVKSLLPCPRQAAKGDGLSQGEWQQWVAFLPPTPGAGLVASTWQDWAGRRNPLIINTTGQYCL